MMQKLSATANSNTTLPSACGNATHNLSSTLYYNTSGNILLLVVLYYQVFMYVTMSTSSAYMYYILHITYYNGFKIPLNIGMVG